MLNELDGELAMRGHRLVRYADGLVLFCKSWRAAERTLASIAPFTESKLLLKAGKGKAAAGCAGKVKFPGISLFQCKGEARVRMHPKPAAKMKAKIRRMTSRSSGWSNKIRMEKLKRYIRGWAREAGAGAFGEARPLRQNAMQLHRSGHYAD
jgi:hypothetical protein